jgi:hypothetical protein
MAKKKKTEAEVEVVESGDFVPETQPMVVLEDNFDMPSDEARKRAMDLRDKMKEEYVEMCRLLFHIQRKQMYSSWGYGTFDELFNVLTLIQTGKIPRVPIVLFDSNYWNPLKQFLLDYTCKKYNAISESDLNYFEITDSLDRIIEIIKTAPVSEWWRNIN